MVFIILALSPSHQVPFPTKLIPPPSPLISPPISPTPHSSPTKDYTNIHINAFSKPVFFSLKTEDTLVINLICVYLSQTVNINMHFKNQFRFQIFSFDQQQSVGYSIENEIVPEIKA